MFVYLQVDASRRIGWKRRLLPPDCAMVPSLHCFPPSLVETPLPLKKFGDYMLPVPRGMKYLSVSSFMNILSQYLFFQTVLRSRSIYILIIGGKKQSPPVAIRLEVSMPCNSCFTDAKETVIYLIVYIYLINNNILCFVLSLFSIPRRGNIF